MELKATPISFSTQNTDRITWSSSPSGSFELKEAYRDCCAVKSFWDSFPLPFSVVVFYGINLIEWLKLNCYSKKRISALNLNWGVVFCFGIWSLWLRQNGFCLGMRDPIGV
ncbi:hypothetical protein CFP56_019206 [Quercus suber]|uniref:Uncharacterized protein n=1 Tax=Quercus suber TaxID=58331 RepID=A0AAW0M0X1_QUESU